MTDVSPSRCASSYSSDGDRAEVAEHVGQVDPERPRVGAHALLLGEHRRVVLGLLEDPQRHGLADVGGDRHRLVRRAVPAQPEHAAVVAAGDQPLPDPRRALVEDAREPLHHDLGPCSPSLPSRVRSTETTHDVRLATSGRPWSSTIRPRWGWTTMSRSDWAAARAW